MQASTSGAGVINSTWYGGAAWGGCDAHMDYDELHFWLLCKI